MEKDNNCRFIPTAAKPSNSSSISCSFEKDTCGWYQDITANFNWVRKQGSSFQNGTGPFVDHTLQNGIGWYMSAEMQSRNPNSKARLVSDAAVQNRTVGCLQFWYHM